MSMKAAEETTAGRTASRWDAVMIGAGPAGAMAAIELARGGASVLLVEKQGFPLEKVCGGCLNGHALGVLRSAGLEAIVREAGGTPLSSFRVGVRGRSFSLALPVGMAVPRSRFDEALVGAAVAAGVQFLPRTEARVESLAAGGATVRLGADWGGRCRHRPSGPARRGAGPAGTSERHRDLGTSGESRRGSAPDARWRPDRTATRRGRSTWRSGGQGTSGSCVRPMGDGTSPRRSGRGRCRDSAGRDQRPRPSCVSPVCRPCPV